MLNCGNGVKKYLDTIQVQHNKIIKILTKTSTSLYNKLSLKIPNLYQTEVCKFLYRCINNKLPTCFSDCFTPVSAIHSCKSRNAINNRFSIHRTNKTLTKRSIKISGAKTWNSSPNYQQNSVKRSKSSFVRSVKITLPNNKCEPGVPW